MLKKSSESSESDSFEVANEVLASISDLICLGGAILLWKVRDMSYE